MEMTKKKTTKNESDNLSDKTTYLIHRESVQALFLYSAIAKHTLKWKSERERIKKQQIFDLTKQTNYTLQQTKKNPTTTYI